MLNLFNANYQYFYAFLYGAIIKIVDDLIDFKNNISPKIKFLTYFLQILLVLITIYIIYFNKDLGIYLSLLFILGGIVGLLFAPSIINEPIWISLILISIPKFIIEIKNIINYIKNINKNDIHDILIFLGPSIIISILFALIEDKVIPEDFSNKKILTRLVQIIFIILFILFYKNFMKIANIKGNYNFIPFVVYPHLGYFITSIIILMLIKLNLLEA